MTDQTTAPPALSISPTLDLLSNGQDAPIASVLVDRRTIYIAGLSLVLGVLATGAAELLTRLINFFTNLSFFGSWSTASVSPAHNRLGIFVIVVPIIGALVIGLIARYGSRGVRGHGIPEAMEQVLLHRSRIPARLVILKPLSAAISIGTGGPFGAEGPIIASGGALGSLAGQILSVTAAERKTLLAAGAAAGMAATFGCPISAVLLAIELLLFELRPRSVIPVALASATAGGLKMAIDGFKPAFAMPHLQPASLSALIGYVVLGAIMGAASAAVTRTVLGIERTFDKLPVHWMWWPALGAAVVGTIGYFMPLTLGIGYDNVSDLLSQHFAFQTVLALCIMKFVSWSISLGSGTSGGTMAPLFTIGGALGAALGMLAAMVAPQVGIDPRIAALVGMAAMFAGASRAFLTSTVLLFETTLQPEGIIPLLAGCAAAYLVSCLLTRHSIMTENISRRGMSSPTEYAVDVLGQVLIRDVASRNVATLKATDTIADVKKWLASGDAGGSHQGFPVLDASGILVGLVTRRHLLGSAVTDTAHIGDLMKGPVKFTYDDCTVRQAVDHMVNHDIGRLPVVSRQQPSRLIGIVTRSDVLSAYRRGIEEVSRKEPGIIALGVRNKDRKSAA